MSIDRNRLAVAGEWFAQGRRLAAATLAEAEGSSPFEAGATMLVDSEGNVEGSEGSIHPRRETAAGRNPDV